MRSSSHIDAVKRDIMRTMSSNKSIFSNRLSDCSTLNNYNPISVAEEEKNKDLNYYEVESDLDLKYVKKLLNNKTIKF